jgi:hypothetical protein
MAQLFRHSESPEQVVADVQRMTILKVPTIPESPFSMTAVSTWTPLSIEGGARALSSRQSILRDTAGRVRQEVWTMVPVGGTALPQLQEVYIADPKQRTGYACLAALMTCYERTLDVGISSVSNAGILPTGELHSGSPGYKVFNVHEDLGTESTDGVDTIVVSDTQTFFNEDSDGPPLETTAHRVWFSKQLYIYLRMEIQNTHLGKVTLEADKLTLTEPDPKLFALPDGYTVQDNRAAGHDAKP